MKTGLPRGLFEQYRYSWVLLLYIGAIVLGLYHSRQRKKLAACYIVLGLSACGFFLFSIEAIITEFRAARIDASGALIRAETPSYYTTSHLPTNATWNTTSS